MKFMARKLLEEYEKWGLKINLEKTFYMSCGAQTKDLILEDQKGCIRGCEEFRNLGEKSIKKTDKKMVLRTGLIKVEQQQQC